MRIVLNGRAEEIGGAMSVAAFVAAKKFKPSAIVVEHNEICLDEADWDEIVLADGDRLEVVSFVGGG